MSSASEAAPPSSPPSSTNRRQLQQIITGLSEGVILIEPDQSITWANEAALAMHGAT
ncbi:PAS domain-containing protein [Xanthomonas arboricola]